MWYHLDPEFRQPFIRKKHHVILRNFWEKNYFPSQGWRNYRTWRYIRLISDDVAHVCFVLYIIFGFPWPFLFMFCFIVRLFSGDFIFCVCRKRTYCRKGTVFSARCPSSCISLLMQGSILAWAVYRYSICDQSVSILASDVLFFLT